MCVVKPHVFQSIDRQQVGGHGEVQFINESGDFRWRIQEIYDGASQIIQLSLQMSESQSITITLAFMFNNINVL